MSKSASAPSLYLKLLLRGLPDDVDINQCLKSLSLKSLYTFHNSKQQTGWISLTPAPSENELIPICQQLMNVTHALSIEKAPLQKIPRVHNARHDIVSDTIGSDPHYLKFLEQLTDEGTLKPMVKTSNELEKDISTVAPIIAFLANRDKNSKSQSHSGSLPPEPSNRGPTRRKKPRKKKEKKKKSDSPEPAASIPSASTVKSAKITDPSSSGVKILTKPTSTSNVRWQIKQPSTTGTN